MKRLDALTVAIAIFTARTRAEAAKALQISERTLYTYLQNYEVQAALKALYSEITTARAADLRAMQSKAAQVACEIMQDHDARAADRLRAAEIILTAGRDAQRDADQAMQDTCEALRDGSEREQNKILYYPFLGSDD